MNKKVYQQPELQVVKVDMQNHLLGESDGPNQVKSVKSATGIGYGGGGNGAAYGRESSGWDDEE